MKKEGFQTNMWGAVTKREEILTKRVEKRHIQGFTWLEA
jgi:hypothetical protein